MLWVLKKHLGETPLQVPKEEKYKYFVTLWTKLKILCYFVDKDEKYKYFVTLWTKMKNINILLLCGQR